MGLFSVHTGVRTLFANCSPYAFALRMISLKMIDVFDTGVQFSSVQFSFQL